MGAAVVLIDHVSKENTGKGGRGSSAKRNKLDGSYRVVVNKPFDRHTIGQVTLYRDKDRDGGLEPKLIYSLGGNGKGNLTCERSLGTIDASDDPYILNDNESKALDVLAEAYLAQTNTEGQAGLTFTEWQKATGIPKGTFSRVRDGLRDRTQRVIEEDGRYRPR